MEETARDTSIAPSDEALLEAALVAARDAAELHRQEAGKVAPADWAEKGVSDFVTEVDLEAERRIIRELRGRFPDHAVIAEEGTSEDADGLGGEYASGGAAGGEPTHGAVAGDPVGAGAPIRWIIDPLDGTTNWLHGYPEYAVSIAALDDRGLRIGVVVNSATGEEFTAVKGQGSRRNGEPFRASEVSALSLALVGTGFPFKRLDLLPLYLGQLGRVLRRTSGVRRGGSAALDLCDLACGRLDAFWELWLMPWDVAAGVLIVREAGGWFGPLELARDENGGEDAEGPLAPALREIGENARTFLDFCQGRASHAPFKGGAYVGANAHLRQAFLELLG